MKCQVSLSFWETDTTIWFILSFRQNSIGEQSILARVQIGITHTSLEIVETIQDYLYRSSFGAYFRITYQVTIIELLVSLLILVRLWSTQLNCGQKYRYYVG